MLELRRNLDLAQEASDAYGRGEALAKHLERDLALVLQVAREVHGGHAAASRSSSRLHPGVTRSLGPQRCASASFRFNSAAQLWITRSCGRAPPA